MRDGEEEINWSSGCRYRRGWKKGKLILYGCADRQQWKENINDGNKGKKQ
ncbi:unnamed protein product [Paramecium octaurelia]|uniref:Uncharacterized protein n=1 Tax=Paramecium octaurelia TaxID=43137 RepID=A0A8S1WA79_PAROT|nr:unnamed protein product [Paramecium octaurelia]